MKYSIARPFIAFGEIIIFARDIDLVSVVKTMKKQTEKELGNVFTKMYRGAETLYIFELARKMNWDHVASSAASELLDYDLSNAVYQDVLKRLDGFSLMKLLNYRRRRRDALIHAIQLPRTPLEAHVDHIADLSKDFYRKLVFLHHELSNDCLIDSPDPPRSSTIQACNVALLIQYNNKITFDGVWQTFVDWVAMELERSPSGGEFSRLRCWNRLGMADLLWSIKCPVCQKVMFEKENFITAFREIMPVVWAGVVF